METTASATSDEQATSAETSDAPAQPATIAIPGYEYMDLVAGRTAQVVDLFNPERNACDFRMTLLLDDGGEALWTSGMVAPGERIGELELARPLEAGEYPATLRYECFSLGDGTPLNGSEIKLTLRVR